MFEKIKSLIHEFNATSIMIEARSRNKLNDYAYADISAGAVIGLAISIIVIAAVIPSAIEQFYVSNTSTWTIDGEVDTKATVLWWLLPFICVATVLYMIYSRM